MKYYKQVIVGNTVVSDFTKRLFVVTDVLYEFAGQKLTKPIIEAELKNPENINEIRNYPLGTHWEFSAIYQDSASDEQLAFKNRVV